MGQKETLKVHTPGHEAETFCVPLLSVAEDRNIGRGGEVEDAHIRTERCFLVPTLEDCSLRDGAMIALRCDGWYNNKFVTP